MRLRLRLFALAIFAPTAFPIPLWAQTPTHTPPPNLACPGDKVVWVNTRSGIYHFRGERYFGSTKEGKFMCEKDADKEGDRPTRNGQ
jgi:hypothetical protein